MTQAKYGGKACTDLTQTENCVTYKFFQGMDSYGNDISQDAALMGKLDKLKEKCNSLPNCKGFNTQGYFKMDIRPETTWNRSSEDINEGLYVKESVYNDLPLGKQYVKIPNWDTSGSDIKKLDGKQIPEIQSECDATSNCVGFNQAGYLKSSITNPMDWTNNNGGALYVRKDKVPGLKAQLKKPFMLQTAQNGLCIGTKPLDSRLIQVPQNQCGGWEQTSDNKLRTTDGKLYWIADDSGNDNGKFLRLSDQYKDQKFVLQDNNVLQHLTSTRCVHPQGGGYADGWGLVTWDQCWDGDNPARIQWKKVEYDWGLKNDERWKNLQ